MLNKPFKISLKTLRFCQQKRSQHILTFYFCDQSLILPQELNNWSVRAVAFLISRIGKTPIVTEAPGGVSVCLQLFLSAIETFARLVVFGGHGAWKLDRALLRAGFQLTPLQLIAKVRKQCGLLTILLKEGGGGSERHYFV